MKKNLCNRVKVPGLLLFLICLFAVLITCAHEKIIDSTIEIGGDRYKKIHFDPPSKKASNLDNGDVAIFYKTDNGFKYTTTDRAEIHLYHLERDKSFDIKKKKEYRLEAISRINYSFIRNDGIRQRFYSRSPVRIKLYVMLTNKGTASINDVYIVEAPPPSIEIMDINLEKGHVEWSSALDKQGRRYYVIHLVEKICPNDIKLVKLDCVVQFDKTPDNNPVKL